MESRTARIHLLPAKAAPFVVVIRRKPSKRFHLIKWNTRTDDLEHGSWFDGKLYPLLCDVSFDGDWMIYFAMGAGGQTWNGVCRPPWLKTMVDSPNAGTWFGGGYWSDSRQLNLNNWRIAGRVRDVPFTCFTYSTDYPEDEGVLYRRLARDGWIRAGEIGPMRRIENSRKSMVVCENDPGWFWQPTPRHPTLRMFYRGYLDYGRTFEFRLDEFPELLGPDVEWATWDALGQLVLTRRGTIQRFACRDLPRGTPTFYADLEALSPTGKHSETNQ